VCRNLRATADNPRYKELVDFWISQRYTLRYSGGLVPDVYHVLVKVRGAFITLIIVIMVNVMISYNNMILNIISIILPSATRSGTRVAWCPMSITCW
jgi:hypothetical protein